MVHRFCFFKKTSLTWLGSKREQRLQFFSNMYRITVLKLTRGKSLLELWVSTTFLPDWQPPLIFIQFISNLLCMCTVSMASAHVILKYIRQRLRVAVSREEKCYPTILKGILPLVFIHIFWELYIATTSFKVGLAS